MSFEMTLPAPTMDHSPMVTFGKILEPVPTKVPVPILTNPSTFTLGARVTKSDIVVSCPMTVKAFKYEKLPILI